MPCPKPAISFICITVLLDVFCVGLVAPVFPKLVELLQEGDVQATAQSIGWLGALYSVMQFVFSPIVGSLSDRFGRRPVLVISLLGASADYLVLAWTPALTWLCLSRAIAGMTAATYLTATAYVADVTSLEKRAAGFGKLGAAVGLGLILGPAVGGLLASHGLRAPVLAAAATALLNGLYAVLVLPESLKRERRRAFDWKGAHPFRAWSALRRWPQVTRLAGTLFFSMLASQVQTYLWVLYTGIRYGWKSTQIGLSLALAGVAVAIVHGWFIGRSVTSIGERRSVYLAFLSMAAAMFCYGAAPAGWMFCCVILLGAIGTSGSALTKAVISQLVPSEEQGAVQGALSGITSLGDIIAPPLWTFLFSWSIRPGQGLYMPGLAFYVAGGISLLAAALAWVAQERSGGTR